MFVIFDKKLLFILILFILLLFFLTNISFAFVQIIKDGITYTYDVVIDETKYNYIFLKPDDDNYRITFAYPKDYKLAICSSYYEGSDSSKSGYYFCCVDSYNRRINDIVIGECITRPDNSFFTTTFYGSVIFDPSEVLYSSVQSDFYNLDGEYIFTASSPKDFQSFNDPVDQSTSNKGLLSSFCDWFIGLFIPEDGYFENQIIKVKDKLLIKLGTDLFIAVFDNIDEVAQEASNSSDDINVSVDIKDYTVSDSLKINVNNFIDFSIFNKYRDTWYSWCRVIIYILVAFFHVDQVTKLLNGFSFSNNNTKFSER